MPLSKFIEVENTSDKPRTIKDRELYAHGGKITVQPGERVTIPVNVFHRMHNPYLASVKSLEAAAASRGDVPDTQLVAETLSEIAADDDAFQPRKRGNKK